MGCEEILLEEKMEDLKEIFLSFNLDFHGILAGLELGWFLIYLGLKPSIDRIEALIKCVDTKTGGIIEFSALVRYISTGIIEEVSDNQE